MTAPLSTTENTAVARRSRHRSRTRRGRLRKAVAAGILAMATATVARAQEEPIIVGQQRRPETFHIERPEIVLDLLARYVHDSTTPAGERESEFTETFFQEILGVKTTGYVISPNLLELNLAGAWGLSQSTVDSDGASSRAEGTLYEFDVSGTLLRRSDAPLTLFGYRKIDLVSRPFGETLETIIQSYGADLSIRSQKAPTTFRVHRLEQTQSSLTGEEDFSYNQDAFEWHTRARLSDTQRLDWDLSLTSVDQQSSISPSTTHDTTDARLTHTVDFGEDGRNNLQSSLTYYDQSGDFEHTRTRWSETLNLRHTDHFDTFWTYELEQSEFVGLSQTRHRGTGGFRHRLYESLVSSGRAGMQMVDYDEGSQTNEQFANLALNYRKKVPLGLLLANVDVGIFRQQNDSGGDAVVIRQPATFDGAPGLPGQPMVIQQQNVGRVMLVDPLTGRVYVQGVEYSLTRRPGEVEIRPLPGSPLVGGTPVFVDLEVLPTDSDVNTNTFAFGLRYEMKEGPAAGLGVYGRYFVQQQDISQSSDAPLVEDDINELTVGADYRIGDLLLAAEHQIHDSTLLPYTSTQYSAQYNRRTSDDLLISAGLQHTSIDYDDEVGSSDLTTASITVEKRLSRTLRVSATVMYLAEDTDTGNETRGLEEQIMLFWRHRQTEVYGLIRNATLDTEAQENSYQVFQIGVQRRF